MIFKLPQWLWVWKKHAESDVASCCNGRHRKFLTLQMPRTEITILLVGLACTVLGKLIVVLNQVPGSLFVALTKVVFPDVLFFATVVLVISCLYLLMPSAFIARCALVIAAVVSIWSVLDLIWLVASGVQLQPGILVELIRDFGEIWPLVLAYLADKIGRAVLLVMMVLGGCLYYLWRFLQPGKVIAVRVHHARWAGKTALVIIVLLLVQPVVRSNGSSDFVSEVLGFSSHWQALISAVTDSTEKQSFPVQGRNVPRVGQRQVEFPRCSRDSLPNVVLVLLESFAYSETSLGNPNLEITPTLARLAREGAEFRLTRVPVSRTTKAWWSVLAATTPVIQANYIEAVSVDQPYEGLPSLLGRIGYRSAFFEMSKGTFECAPGFFDNLAFDWAWFRENLEDPSAHLGYMSGDDCRLLEPAFKWVSKDSRPFFLMIQTSVSHDSYEVPAFFEKPKQDRYERYLQTVRYTDYFLEQLCRALNDRGLDKNTILCILGDHGTSFRVQASKGRWVPYEEVLRVPWVIYWPGHIKAGQRIDWPCSQLDVTPTILKLIGFDIAQAGFEGKDAFTPSQNNRRLYFSSWHFDSPMGFIEGCQKVVYWPYVDKVFVYNLKTDPKEENPKIVSPAQTEQIKRDILNWQKTSYFAIAPGRYTKRFLFLHWRTFNTGSSAETYYVP